MKILHCIHSCNPEGGGAWEAVLQFSKQHIKQGHEVLAICTDAPDAPWCKNPGMPLQALGPARNGYGYTPGLRAWLGKHAREFDCTIVHGLWQYPGRAVLKFLHPKKIPYYVYPHGMLDPWFKQAYPFKHLKKAIYWKFNETHLLRNAESVLFTCEEERRLAQGTFNPYRCIGKVAPLGIEPPVGNPVHQEQVFLQKHPGLEKKGFLLFLSRIHEKKGLDLLLEALGRLPRPLPPLVVAGPVDSPNYTEKLKKMEADLTRRQGNWKIIWTGMLKGDEKWGALRTAEAFILPSHQENFGIAVVEAMSVGTPVLLSRKVNIWREIIEDNAGIAGADTVQDTLGTLQQWQGLDDEARAQMGSNASQCFARRFEISKAAEHLIRVLQRRDEAYPRQA